jgi:hypothetical protein
MATTIYEGTVVLTITMFLQSVTGVDVPTATTDLTQQGITMGNVLKTGLPAGSTVSAPVVSAVVVVQDYPT